MTAHSAAARHRASAHTSRSVRRRLSTAAVVTGVIGASTVGFTAVLGSPAHAAPGNNGTVKIDDSSTIVDVDDVATNNIPKVACRFLVEWFDFEAPATTSVSFEGTPGSPSFTVDGDLTPTLYQDPAAGAGNDFDGRTEYTVHPSDPTYMGELHIKVTVHTSASNGDDTKYKVFKVEGCGTPPADDGGGDTTTGGGGDDTTTDDGGGDDTTTDDGGDTPTTDGGDSDGGGDTVDGYGDPVEVDGGATDDGAGDGSDGSTVVDDSGMVLTGQPQQETVRLGGTHRSNGLPAVVAVPTRVDAGLGGTPPTTAASTNGSPRTGLLAASGALAVLGAAGLRRRKDARI